MADITNASSVESPEDFGEGEAALVKRWLTEINISEKEFSMAPRTWYETGNKIVARYRDERADDLSVDVEKSEKKFNVLWANVQLLQPALYSRTPKPEVTRRFKAKDPVARAASTLLERAIAYTLDTQDFGAVMNGAVLDRLLPGRGVTWVRYVPTMESVTPRINLRPDEVGQEAFDDDGKLIAQELRYLDDDGKSYEESVIKRDDDDMPYADGEPHEEVKTEKALVDYVYWRDFGHTTARNWGEVRAVWRRSYMTRDALIERFGKDKGTEIKLDYTPKNMVSGEEGEPANELFKKATVYEIWDKDTKRALWINASYDKGPLDIEDDPLGLEGFFPVPKPIFATTTTDTMVPVPDYMEYVDQAKELDTLTSRMSRLMAALKVRGVYDGKLGETLGQLLDSAENTLIPVDEDAMFGGGSKMADHIAWFPVQEVAATLMRVIEVREVVKRDLQELTGLSDVMRGSSDPNETLGAQQLKGQYGTLRLKNSISDVQRFARDNIAIIGEIISEHFSAETIREIAGMDMSTKAEVMEAQAKIKEYDMMVDKTKEIAGQGPEQEAQAKQVMQALPDKSEIDHIRDISNDVPFEDAIALLKDQGARSFRLDIETDSTIAVDEADDKKSATEFLTSSSNFMQMSMQMGAQVPEYVPLLGQMLMFSIRRFKAGRQLEDSFEEAIDAIQRRMDEQADNPQEDPAQVLETKRLELEGKQLAFESEKLEVDKVEKEAKLKLEAEKNKLDALNGKTKVEQNKADRAAKVKIEQAKIADTSAARKEARDHEARTAGLPPEDEMSEISEAILASTQAMAEMMQQQAEQSERQTQILVQVMTQTVAAITAPKEIIYKDGRPSGAVTVMPEQMN